MGKVLSTSHAYSRAMTWESEVDRYVNWLEISGRSGHPASAGYITNLRSYAGALGRTLKPGQSFMDLTQDRFFNWLIGVRDHGISGKRTEPLADASLNSIKGVLKAFFRHLNDDVTPAFFKGLVVGKNRSRAARSDLPTDDEVGRLANALSPRYKAIFLTIRYSGARPAEVLKMRRKDVSPEWQLTFKDTKTKVHRDAALANPVARRALKAWMGQAPEAPEDSYLFPSSKSGEPLGSRSLWIAQKRAAIKLGVDPINPYLLRHARGTQLMDEGVNDAIIMQQMGWKSDATARNYQHPDPEKSMALLEEMEGEEGITQEGFQGLLDQLFSGLKESGFGIELEHEVSQQVEEGEMVSHIFVTGMKAVRRKDHLLTA